MKRSKRFIAAFFALALCANLGYAQFNRPADKPVPRTDRNSQIADEQLVEKAKRGGIDVHFLGDSITRRWGATDYPAFLANWRSNFFGWNAANFGWGADRIEQQAVRGHLEGRAPSRLEGLSNLGRRTEGPPHRNPRTSGEDGSRPAAHGRPARHTSQDKMI